jgi:hypothetical protein
VRQGDLLTGGTSTQQPGGHQQHAFELVQDLVRERGRARIVPRIHVSHPKIAETRVCAAPSIGVRRK